MKILGYLLVVALFGANNKPLLEDVKNNFKIEFQKVGLLVKDLFKNNSDTKEPIFTRDDLIRGNLVNKGTVAKYYSKNVRDYIIHHNISADEEGFVLTLQNFNLSAADRAEDKDSKYKEKAPTVIFIPKKGVDINDVENEELSSAISGYVDSVQKKIDSGEIGGTKVPLKKDVLEVDIENNHLSVHPMNKNKTDFLPINKTYVQKPSVLNGNGTENLAEGSLLTKHNTLPFNQCRTNNKKSKQEENQLGIKYIKTSSIDISDKIGDYTVKLDSDVNVDEFEDKTNTGEENFGIPEENHQFSEMKEVKKNNEIKNISNTLLSSEVNKIDHGGFKYQVTNQTKNLTANTPTLTIDKKVNRGRSSNVRNSVESKHKPELLVNETANRTNTTERNFRIPVETITLNKLKPSPKNEKTFNLHEKISKPIIDLSKLNKSKNTNFHVERTTLTSNFNDKAFGEKTYNAEENNKVPKEEYSPNVKDHKVVKPDRKLDWTKRTSYLKDNNSTKAEEETSGNRENVNSRENNLKKETNYPQLFGGETTLNSNFNENVFDDKTNKSKEKNEISQKGNSPTEKDRKEVKPDEKLPFDWTKWESYLKDNNSTKAIEEISNNRENENSQKNNPQKETNNSPLFGDGTTLTTNFNENAFGEKTNKDKENNKVPKEGSSPNIKDRKVVKPDEKFTFDWTKWESYLKDNNSSRGEEGISDKGKKGNLQEDTNKSHVYSGETMNIHRKENKTTVFKTSNQINCGTNNAVQHNDNTNKEGTLGAPHDIKEKTNLKNEHEFQRKWDLKENTENEENYSGSEEDYRPILEIIDEDELERAEKEGYYIEIDRSHHSGAASEEYDS